MQSIYLQWWYCYLEYCSWYIFFFLSFPVLRNLVYLKLSHLHSCLVKVRKKYSCTISDFHVPRNWDTVNWLCTCRVWLYNVRLHRTWAFENIIRTRSYSFMAVSNVLSFYAFVNNKRQRHYVFELSAQPMWVRSVSRCYRPWNSQKIRCSLFLFSVKMLK